MNPETAIQNMETMLGEINKLVSTLRWESEDIAEQWQALGMVGGQRADHAAQLLGRMRNNLHALAQFCTDCETQITGMVADPFGRNAA